jgi:hypothetical protein
MPSFKTIGQIALITVASMYVLNLLAAKIPQARTAIKGVNLIAV